MFPVKTSNMAYEHDTRKDAMKNGIIFKDHKTEAYEGIGGKVAILT